MFEGQFRLVYFGADPGWTNLTSYTFTSLAQLNALLNKFTYKLILFFV